MRRLLALAFSALALLWLAPAPADAGVLMGRIKGHNLGSVSLCSDDGHATAPLGTPLYPERRALWASPPPCHVPDVDDPEGADNDCAACVDPSTASYPSGVGWNASAQRLDCSGAADGTKIQNLDFTKLPTSGSGILVSACDHVVIENVKVRVDCANTHISYPIRQLSGSTGITVNKVTLDGGGKAGEVCFGSTGELIYLQGSGTQTVTHVRAVNVGQHWLTSACVSCATDFRYNSVSRFSFAQGEHANGVQWLGISTATTFNYNYYFNPQPDVADDVRTACFGPSSCANDNVGGTVSALNGQVVVTLLGTNASDYLVGMQLTGSGVSGTAYICAVTDYGDGTFTADHVLLTLKTDQACTTTANTTHAVSSTAQVQNAYPSGITAAMWFLNQAIGGGTFGPATIKGNVFDGTTPLLGGTYAINCLGNHDTVTITGNYINLPGYSGGLFRSDAGCPTVVGSGNKSLAGASISVP